MNTQLVELGGKLEAKRSEWMNAYAAFEAKGDDQAKVMTGEDVARFKSYEQEVGDLQKQYDALKSVYDSTEQNRKALEDGYRPSAPMVPGQRVKSVGEIVLAKGLRPGTSVTFDEVDPAQWLKTARFGTKATMTTSANGFPPEVGRDGDVVGAIYRPPQLLDFLRIEPTNSNAIKFMAETVRTTAAAAKSEAAALDEATITYAEQTDIISRIGHYIPVTDEQLEDEPGLLALINRELGNMVYEALDDQATVGSGVDPILLGIYTGAGQTQAKGADSVLDAIHKAITKVRVTGRSRPNLVVLHAGDWQDIALTKTTDGVYVLGNPTDGAPLRVWGLPVALSESLTEGNGMVIDTDYFSVKMRKGLTVEMTNAHGTNFINNINVIRAYVRAGIKHRRSYAACKVTGI